MSPLMFYRGQAAEQKTAAEAATLQNVRDRCQRASDAWTALAVRTEQSETARLAVTAAKQSLESTVGGKD